MSLSITIFLKLIIFLFSRVPLATAGFTCVNQQINVLDRIMPGGKTSHTEFLRNDLVKRIIESFYQTITFVYNSRNYVESKIDPTATVIYGYDNSTLLKTVIEGLAVITCTYDERGRLNTFTIAYGDLIHE